jgi:hypothetical protein
MPEIIFSGKSTAIGRNGFFKLRTASLATVESRRPTRLEFHSQRRGTSGAPIQLQLTREDAAALARLLSPLKEEDHQ